MSVSTDDSSVFGGSGGERHRRALEEEGEEEEGEEEKEMEGTGGVLLEAEGNVSVMLKDPDHEGASAVVASSSPPPEGWTDSSAFPSSCCSPLAWAGPEAPSSVWAMGGQTVRSGLS